MMLRKVFSTVSSHSYTHIAHLQTHSRFNVLKKEVIFLQMVKHMRATMVLIRADTKYSLALTDNVVN